MYSHRLEWSILVELVKMVEINQTGQFGVERLNNNFGPYQMGEKINFKAETNYHWLSYGR